VVSTAESALEIDQFIEEFLDHLDGDDEENQDSTQCREKDSRVSLEAKGSANEMKAMAMVTYTAAPWRGLRRASWP
jgi:hypothetical protein